MLFRRTAALGSSRCAHLWASSPPAWQHLQQKPPAPQFGQAEHQGSPCPVGGLGVFNAPKGQHSATASHHCSPGLLGSLLGESCYSSNSRTSCSQRLSSHYHPWCNSIGSRASAAATDHAVAPDATPLLTSGIAFRAAGVCMRQLAQRHFSSSNSGAMDASSDAKQSQRQLQERAPAGMEAADVTAPLLVPRPGHLQPQHQELLLATAAANYGAGAGNNRHSQQEPGGYQQHSQQAYMPVASSDHQQEAEPRQAVSPHDQQTNSHTHACPTGDATASRLWQQQQLLSTSRSTIPAALHSWRYLVTLCALSVVICYADRSNISTAVLPMAAEFGWDKTYQGLVMSSFFIGYALTQVAGGHLADRYGGKRVLAAGVSLWSLFTFFTPQAAAAGTVPLVASRILLGVGEGVAFPAIHSLIARNVPACSQSTAVGVVTAAAYAGTALAFGISPWIISHWGWPWVFHMFAALALVWLPMWLPLSAAGGSHGAGMATASSTTSSSSSSSSGLLGGISGRAKERRSDTELCEVAQEAGALSKLNGFSHLDSAFWPLMKRKEVWAILAAQYCQSWGMYGLLNWLPTFFADHYHVQVSDLASYTLLPYLVQGGVGVVTGVIADRLLASGWSVKRVRTVLQVSGMLGPAACLLTAVSPLTAGSPTAASVLITTGLGLSALTLGGVSVSHLDIAPRHAGAVFGAGNTAATLAGALSVPLTGLLLQATGSWSLVFGVTAGHYAAGAALWCMWAGDRQLPEDTAGYQALPTSSASADAARH